VHSTVQAKVAHSPVAVVAAQGMAVVIDHPVPAEASYPSSGGWSGR